MEAIIPDLRAKDIIDDVVTPRFKNSDYDSGVYNGVVAIANIIYEEQDKNLLSYSDNYINQPKREFSDTPAFAALIILATLSPWSSKQKYYQARHTSHGEEPMLRSSAENAVMQKKAQ